MAKTKQKQIHLNYRGYDKHKKMVRRMAKHLGRSGASVVQHAIEEMYSTVFDGTKENK